MGSLENKIAIITGGAAGIGKATAKRFLKEGAKVLIVDINEEALKNTVAELQNNNLSFSIADISKEEDTKRYVQDAINKFGPSKV